MRSNMLDTAGSGQVVTLVISYNFRKYTRAHTQARIVVIHLCARWPNKHINQNHVVHGIRRFRYYRTVDGKKGLTMFNSATARVLEYGNFPSFHSFVFFFSQVRVHECHAEFKQVMQKLSLSRTHFHADFLLLQSLFNAIPCSIVFPLNLFVNKFWHQLINCR